MLRFFILCSFLLLPGVVRAQDEPQSETESPDKEETLDLKKGVTFLKFAPNVPVIPGFGETLDFSKLRTEPDGRYIEAWLKGSKPSDDALRLYKTSLPKYGWTIESEIDIRGKGPVLVFSQKQQRLRITVYADTSDASLLRFEISPIGK